MKYFIILFATCMSLYASTAFGQGLSERVDVLEARANETDSEQAVQDQRLTDLENNDAVQDQNILDLDTRVTDLDDRVTSLENEAGAIVLVDSVGTVVGHVSFSGTTVDAGFRTPIGIFTHINTRPGIDGRLVGTESSLWFSGSNCTGTAFIERILNPIWSNSFLLNQSTLWVGNPTATPATIVTNSRRLDDSAGPCLNASQTVQNLVPAINEGSLFTPPFHLEQ